MAVTFSLLSFAVMFAVGKIKKYVFKKNNKITNKTKKYKITKQKNKLTSKTVKTDD